MVERIWGMKGLIGQPAYIGGPWRPDGEIIMGGKIQSEERIWGTRRGKGFG